jgi:hypothetical protein
MKKGRLLASLFFFGLPKLDSLELSSEDTIYSLITVTNREESSRSSEHIEVALHPNGIGLITLIRQDANITLNLRQARDRHGETIHHTNLTIATYILEERSVNK